MANDLTTSPMRIDTFGADVVVSADPIWVTALIATGYSSAKTVTFIDADAANVLVLEVSSGGTGQFTPAIPVLFRNGLTFDDSESDLASGDFVFIFIE